MKANIRRKNVFNPIAITFFVITTGSTLGAYYLGYISVITACAGFILSLLAASAIKIADQWEKGSLIIVPSSALESMNLGAIGGLTALASTTAEIKHDKKEVKAESGKANTV